MNVRVADAFAGSLITDTRGWRGLMELCSIVTGKDPGVLLSCSKDEQIRCLHEAGGLVMIYALVNVCWVAFTLSVAPLAQALLIGTFVASIIVWIDIRVGVALEHTLGLLRTSRDFMRAAPGIILRMVITLALSSVSALGLTQFIYSEPIARERIEITKSQNAELRAEFDARKQRALADHQRASTNLIERRKELDTRSRAAAASKVRASEEADKYTKQAREEEFNQVLELRGVDRLPGDGPNWAKATAAEKKARDNAASEKVREQQLTQELDRVGGQIAQIDTDLAQLSKDLDTRLVELERDYLAHPSYIRDRADPLLNHLALDQLFRSPLYGEAAKSFHWQMMLVICVLELSFLLVKVLCRINSEYVKRIDARSKLVDLRLTATLEREAIAMRRDIEMRIDADDAEVRQ